MLCFPFEFFRIVWSPKVFAFLHFLILSFSKFSICSVIEKIHVSRGKLFMTKTFTGPEIYSFRTERHEYLRVSFIFRFNSSIFQKRQYIVPHNVILSHSRKETPLNLTFHTISSSKNIIVLGLLILIYIDLHSIV